MQVDLKFFVAFLKGDWVYVIVTCHVGWSHMVRQARQRYGMILVMRTATCVREDFYDFMTLNAQFEEFFGQKINIFVNKNP